MAILNIPCVRSSLITWVGNRGAAATSDLRLPLFNRIYDDAFDEGFAVCSDKTRKIMIFRLSSTHEEDGEETAWIFTCAGELSEDGKSIDPLPEDQFFSILIAND